MFSEPKLASESLGLFTGQYGRKIVHFNMGRTYLVDPPPPLPPPLPLVCVCTI